MLKKAISTFGIGLLFLCIPVAGFAENVAHTTTQIEQHNASTSAKGQERMCQVRGDIIKKRFGQGTNEITTIETKFDAILKSIENYYITKALPMGKTVPNYDALVSNITAKRAAIDAAAAVLKTDADTFSCTSSDVQGEYKKIQKDMQTLKSALNEYKNSIKDLLLAVRLAIVKHEKNSLTPTTSVSITPTPTI